jgi:hypothetical protein
MSLEVGHTLPRVPFPDTQVAQCLVYFDSHLLRPAPHRGARAHRISLSLLLQVQPTLAIHGAPLLPKVCSMPLLVFRIKRFTYLNCSNPTNPRAPTTTSKILPFLFVLDPFSQQYLRLVSDWFKQEVHAPDLFNLFLFNSL